MYVMMRMVLVMMRTPGSMYGVPLPGGTSACVELAVASRVALQLLAQ